MREKPESAYHLGDIGLLHNVLNETLNGFVPGDLEKVIGMNRSKLNELLEHLPALPDGAEVDLDLSQAVAFRNALRETLRQLGIEEFSTRTGYDFELGEKVLEELNRFIAANERA